MDKAISDKGQELIDDFEFASREELFDEGPKFMPQEESETVKKYCKARNALIDYIAELGG